MSVTLYKPTVGSTGWGNNVNSNFTLLENALQSIAFLARVNTAQVLPNLGVNTVVDFSSVDFNAGGGFDTTLNRFVAPVAGYYWFHGSGVVGNIQAGWGWNLALWSGQPTTSVRVIGAQGTAGINGGQGSAVAAPLLLAQGDIVELVAQVFNPVNGTFNASANINYFGGFRMFGL